jgi:hypothetical protein
MNLRIMARVTLAPGLQGISGKVGNLVFRTYQNGHVHVHKAKDYASPPRRASPGELANRRRFAFVSRLTAEIQHLYEWVDAAARDRKKIREIVQYQYDRLLARYPQATDEDLGRWVRAHYASHLSRKGLDNVAEKRGDRRKVKG